MDKYFGVSSERDRVHSETSRNRYIQYISPRDKKKSGLIKIYIHVFVLLYIFIFLWKLCPDLYVSCEMGHLGQLQVQKAQEDRSHGDMVTW